MPVSLWLTGVTKPPTAGNGAATTAVTVSTSGSDILTRSGAEKKLLLHSLPTFKSLTEKYLSLNNNGSWLARGTRVIVFFYYSR